MRANKILKAFVLMVAAFSSFGLPGLARAQDQDESKAIKAEVFIKNRRATTKKSPGRYKPAAKAPTATNADAPPPGMNFEQVGITFWRFRPSTAADKTKELVEEEDGPKEWTLERIEEGTPLSPGQFVRFSIESLTRSGYLYVINREQYADGTLGDPSLIFPTLKTYDNNYAKPGRLIYIPSATGKFRIKPSEGSKPHVGELVTILVTPQPLIAKEQLSTKAIKLPGQQVEAWEKQWRSKETRFEFDGGAGQTMTEKEQSAANNSTDLTQDDPAPQTVYRLAIKSADWVLLSVPLKFRR